jgi:hypothetical protein
MLTKTLYLESQIVLGSMFLILWLIAGKCRKIILIGALRAIPLGFLNFIFNEVWNPDRLINGYATVEDFSFCFFSGGLTLALVNWTVNYTGSGYSFVFRWRRLILTSIWGIVIIFLGFLFGIWGYQIIYLSMVVSCILLIALKRPFWKIFLAGSVSMLIFYTVGLHLGFLIWPELIHFWTLENMSGILIGRVPLEEMIWAFLFGGTWPVIFLYVSGPPAEEFKWRKFRHIGYQ